MSVDYFNLIQSMDRMVGETNEALQKQMDSDFFPENSDQSRNMIEKILKALKDVFSESEARLSYLGTYSSHVFTNPEFPTCYWHFVINLILKWQSIWNRSKQTTKFMGEKKSDFVDSGFVKTCDELVIGSKVFKERGLTYTSESIMDEHY